MKKPTYCITDMNEAMEQICKKVRTLPGIESSCDDALIIRDTLGRKQLKLVLTFDLVPEE